MFAKFIALCLLASAVCGAEPHCPNEGVVKLANPNDPAGFYLCLHGDRMSFKCENGKIFDHISQVCELFVREEVRLPRINPLCPATGWSLIPHDISCSKFFKCNEGVATVMVCPLGLHYDPATEHCDYPDVVKCTLENQTQAPTSAAPATSTAATKPATDATTASDATPASDATTASDATPASDATTAGDTPTPTDATTATDAETATDATTSQLTTVRPTTSDDFRTTIAPTTTPAGLTTLPGAVPPQNLNCDLACATETAYVPDQSSCDKYWRCENGAAVSEKCTIGLRFNRLSKTCDYAINVKCI